MTAHFVVTAYRNRRAYALHQGDFAERADTREEAEAARQRLAERSSRYRLGWQYLDIRPVPAEEAP